MNYKYCFEEFTVEDSLDLYGAKIIPSVLTDDECQNMFNGIWDFFECITKNWELSLDRNKPETFVSFKKLFPIHNMLVQHWDVGHTQVSWSIRQNLKIVEIFAKMYNCTPEELLVSFDGLSFNLPTKRKMPSKTWYHTDQSYRNNEKSCIQGLVTALDVNEGSSTFTFMKGSHKFHGEFAKTFANKFEGCKWPSNNWYKLNPEEEKWYFDKGCEYIRVKCPKGSVILWDSRTIHCGIQQEINKAPEYRAVIYVCYQPRKLASEKDIIKKQKAFNEMRSTTHYPCKVKLFPKDPQTYGAPLPVINKIERPVLNELGLKLASF